MVDEFRFLEENTWDYDPVEEEEEPDFDQIVAQNLTDQQFIEQNVQLPTSEPAPEVVVAPSPAPEPSYNQPQDRGPQPPSGYGAPPEPPPAQPLSLAEMLLQEQNQLPELAPGPDPFMDWAYNDSPLAQQIQQDSLAYDEVTQSLNSLLPGDALLSATPERLDQLENHRGYGVGPLAGLNHQIASKNIEYQDVISQLDAMNPENFTTQAQVDSYNHLITRYTTLQDDLNGLIEQYTEVGGGLVDQQGQLQESLYGEEGSLAKFNKLYGPGGLADQRAVMGEGLVGAGQEPDPTPAISRDLYNMLRSGQATTTSLDEAMGGSAYKLTDAGQQAIENAQYEGQQVENYQRRRRQQIELGFTTEQLGQFRDDPGFQEYANSLIVDRNLPPELQDMGLNQLAMSPGQSNDYRPGPTLVSDIAALGNELTNAWGALPDPAKGLVMANPGFAATGFALQNPERSMQAGGLALKAVDAPGRLAFAGAYQTARDLQDIGRIPYDLLTGGSADATVFYSRASGRDERIIAEREQFSENHPFITVGGEVVLDPLNFIGGTQIKGVYKAIRFSGETRNLRGATGIAYESAMRGGTLADTKYLQSVEKINTSQISKIDSFKITDSQARFTETAVNALGVHDEAALEFGNRVTFRMYTSPDQQWGNILNEELGRLGERTNTVITAEVAQKFNDELASTQAFSKLYGSDFWKSLDGQFPRAQQDTPQWRKVREVELPNPDDVTDVRAGETPQLDNLVAVGHGPQITADERWANVAEIDADTLVTPRYRYRPDFLTPTNERPPADAVTDDMLTVLNRQAREANVALESAPTTLDEYDRAWKRVIAQKGDKEFPAGRTLADVTTDPRYQLLHQNAKGLLSGGIAPPHSAAPVDTYQLSKLIQHSYIHNRNLLDDLFSAVGEGPPLSSTRFGWIVSNLKPTSWQKAQIRKIAKKGKRAFPESAFENMTVDNANEIIWANRRKKYKDDLDSIKKVTTVYEEDPLKVIQMSRDDLVKNEMRASLTDLLTAQGGDRYALSRPVKRADGTTAAGWARLTEWELLNAITKASDDVLHLPTYGGPLAELTENVRRMAAIRVGGGQKALQHYPQLLADSRNIISDLLDEMVDVASPGETFTFHKWLVGLYDSSYLPRAGDVIRKPDDFLPDNPNMIDLAQVVHEIGYRQAERAGVLDMLKRFQAVSVMTAGEATPLNWNELARMTEDEAVGIIQEFLNNPNTAMDRDGFFDMLRVVNWKPLGGRGNVTIRDTLREYRRLVQADRTLRQELSGFNQRAQGIANKLGVDGIENLTNFSMEPNIQQFVRQFENQYAEFARYQPDYSMPLSNPENRKRVLDESTQEVTYAAGRAGERGKLRDASLYTPHVWEAEIFEGRPRYVSRGSWENNPQLNERLQRAFSEYNAVSANKMSVDQIASKLISSNIPFAPDDLTSQALLMHGYSFKEMSDIAGISQNAAKRLRQSINNELTRGTKIDPRRIADDARAMREAIGIADNFYTVLSEQPTRLAAGSEPSKIQLVAGKLQIPDGLVNPLLSYLDDQYKLSLMWQPGKLTKAAAAKTREVLSTVLDFFNFSVNDRTLSDRVMNMFGDEGARFIRPQHQRPVVPIFDPFGVHLGKIQWKAHAKIFDEIMSVFHTVDPVWGKQAKKFSPFQLRELTKMSKGIEIGNTGALVGHTAARNIMELASRGRENVADVYSDILNHLDQIVEGGPAMDALYSDMFENSEKMQTWLRWARATDADGVRMWDKVTENWGDLIPHMSISKMPKSLHDVLFSPMRTGLTRRSRSGNRAPVLRDVKQLDEFIHGRMNLDDLGLSGEELIEIELWREALSANWSDIRPQLMDGVSGEFRKGVHVDDLDSLFQFDAVDPYDPQRFSEALGTMMTYFEHDRLGYHPDNVSWALKWNQGVKASFGFVWLRTSPRYFINNGFGNYSSIGVNLSHSDRATGILVPQRIDDALSSKYSSVFRIPNLGQGLAETELAWGGPRAAVSKQRQKIEKAEKVASLFKEGSSGKLGFVQNSVWAPIKRAGKAYVEFNARATDHLELDARKRVWSVEFDFEYQKLWEAGLDQLGDLDPVVREAINGQLELADIAKVLNQNGIDNATRNKIFKTHNVAINRAHLKAYNSTKDVMRDYLIRNRFDNALDQIFPYHFWMTKNLAFVTGTVLDRPATVLQGARIYDTWAEQWEGMPYSFRERIHIKKVPGFVPGIGGKEIGFRPHNMTNPAFFILPAVIDEMRDAWERYEDMPIFERFARTSAGGAKQAWEEMGYSAGPHLDAVVGVTTSKEADNIVSQVSDGEADAMKRYLDSGLNLTIRPQGFEQELLPLGGLEDGLLWAAGTNSKTDVVRNWYASANQLVKGSSFTRAEVNKMGFILYEMARDGEITEEQFDEVQRLIVAGDFDGLDQHEIGDSVLNRMYQNQGERSTIGYMTSLSYAEYGPQWREAFEANEHYQQLKSEDQMIPVPPGATDAQRKAIDGFNARIKALQAENQKTLDINNFNPDAIAEATTALDVGLYKIYREASSAGLDVPQWSGDGPRAASEWAFGKWNPETQQREGANAPWLGIYWRANDNQDDLDARESQNEDWQRNQRKNEAIWNAWNDKAQRRGETAPYFNQIDDIREEERTKLNELYGRGLSETAERRLEDQIMDNTRRSIGRVYDAAEQAGISLRGAGNVPSHTSSWYDLSDSGNADIRYVYEQAGVGIPRDRELLTLDQAIQLNAVEDQVEAHTTWAMRETIESLDLSPYLPNGEPNPRFMVDGYFSRELWEETVKRSAPQVLDGYTSLVRSYRDISRPLVAEGEDVDLMARPITFDEFWDFAQNDVLSRQSAYDMAMSASLDRVFNSSGEERDRLVEQGIREFGPTFGDIARGDRIRIDMDDVATTITNFYNGLTGQEKKSFEEQYGDYIVDGGDIRVIDSEALTYRDAVLIADRYGLEIPTYAQQFELSRNRQALVDTWNLLSNDQKRELKDTWAEDESLPDDFVLTLSGTDDESGEPFNFNVAAFDALNEPQVANLIRQLDAPVDSYFPDPNEDTGTANPRTPKFERMMAQAEQDKREQVVEESFHSGEAFLNNPQDVQAYQSVQALREQYPDLYDAGKKFIDEHGVSWEWLVENLEPRAKEGGNDSVTLREFAEMYTYTLDEADYGRLMNERRKWLRDEGQEYPALIQYLDDRDPTVEDAKMQAEAGTLYGFEGEDLENWQEFYAWREANDHLYYAAQAIKNEEDVTWTELAAGLEDGAIKEFAEAYLKRIDDYDMGRLWDQRGAFFATEYGQSLVARDPDEFAGLVDLGSGGGGSSSGGSRSSGGGRSYSSGGRSFGSSGSSQRRPASTSGKTMSDFPTDIRDIFRLDSAMMVGDAPDSQARYDVAIQVAELIQQKLSMFDMILGSNNDLSRILMQLYTRNIKKILGDNPTIDLWQQVLQSLGAGEKPAQPSEELLAEEAIAAD